MTHVGVLDQDSGWRVITVDTGGNVVRESHTLVGMSGGALAHRAAYAHNIRPYGFTTAIVVTVPSPTSHAQSISGGERGRGRKRARERERDGGAKITPYENSSTLVNVKRWLRDVTVAASTSAVVARVRQLFTGLDAAVSEHRYLGKINKYIDDHLRGMTINPTSWLNNENAYRSWTFSEMLDLTLWTNMWGRHNWLYGNVNSRTSDTFKDMIVRYAYTFAEIVIMNLLFRIFNYRPLRFIIVHFFHSLFKLIVFFVAIATYPILGSADLVMAAVRKITRKLTKYNKTASFALA